MEHAYRELVLVREMEGSPTGDQQAEAGSTGEQRGHIGSGFQHLLHVVEHQQAGAVCQNGAYPIDERAVAGFVYTQCMGDSREDEARVTNLGERDECDAAVEDRCSMAATARASRVFPTPPGPVSVMRRAVPRDNIETRLDISRSRPMSVPAALGIEPIAFPGGVSWAVDG